MAIPIRDEPITGEEALELLDAAVAARGAKHRYPARTQRKSGVPTPFYGEPITNPDWDYNELEGGQARDADESSACHYFATERDAALVKAVDEGAPMCIVGVVLNDLGVTVSDLGPVLNTSSGVEAMAWALNLGSVFDGRALAVLAAAQEQQDGGLTWGDAVANARAFFHATAEE